MLLGVDVGNTNTVFALFDGDVVKHNWRCQTDSARTADEYAAFLKQMFEIDNVDWHDIKDVVISTVVPDAHFPLTSLCKTYIKKEPVFVDLDHVGLTVEIDQPREVGADRLANGVAVIHNYSLPAVVIDFGTATTFDVINKGGVYCGGVIAPGVRLSISALAERAAQLPKITIKEPKKTIGKNTQEAMQSGMYWGYIGMIEKILHGIADEIGEKPYVIATGGLAPLYAQNTQMIDAVDENLILKGLLEIYKNNNNS